MDSHYHQLETGVPVVANTITRRKQGYLYDADIVPFDDDDDDNDGEEAAIEMPSFDTTVCMYGMGSGVNLQFALIGFLQLIIIFKAHGNAIEMAEYLLRDRTAFWMYTAISMVFTFTVYGLSYGILGYRFHGTNSRRRSDSEENNEEEAYEQDKIVQVSFAVGNLTSGFAICLLSDFILGVNSAICVHASVYALGLVSLLIVKRCA